MTSKKLILGIMSLILFASVGIMPAMAASSVSRTLPATIYNGTTSTVTLTVAVDSGVTFYAIDEIVPSGLTVTTASDGGDFTAQAGHVKWLVISGAVNKALTYTVSVPATATGIKTWIGTYQFEGMSAPAPIAGDNSRTITVQAGAAAGTSAPRIWSADKAPAVPYIWNSLNFEGFYYDIKYDRSTETLELLEINAASRNIPEKRLVYTTRQVGVDFKVNEKEPGITVDGAAQYNVVGWQGEKWIATKTATNKIAKLIYEMDKDDKKTLTTGETWVLGAGYELTINAIDMRTIPRQVWMTLKKDGVVIDEGIGQAPASGSVEDKQKAVYLKKMTILGESNALLFTVYVSNIFPDATSNMVQFQYAWLIDASSAKEIKSDDTYGVFKVTSLDPIIRMDNENSISLSKNSDTTLMENMKFKVADSDTLRFYPFVERTTPGIYETRGTVVQESTIGAPLWNAYNFAGFLYDIKYDRMTETLGLANSVSAYSATRSIPNNQLIYSTRKVPVDFKIFDTEGLTVDGAAQYNVVGWQGEKWVAVKGVTNKLAKLVFEMGKDDKKTLTTGETWVLGAGYELSINAIDMGTIPRQVWMTLKKDGAIIDEGIVQAPASGSVEDKQKAVYFKKKTILGESDALLFTVYVSNIFPDATSNMVQFKYAWLIDESSATEIYAADKFGVFEVRTASSDAIMMANENTISLSKNSEATLMGNLKFKVADSDTLRFYPKVDYIISDSSISSGALATISVTPTSAALNVSQSKTFTATGKDAAGNTVPATVSWTLSNNTVGVITSGGVFTAVANGTTTVTATSGTISGNATVRVGVSLIDSYRDPVTGKVEKSNAETAVSNYLRLRTISKAEAESIVSAYLRGE